MYRAGQTVEDHCRACKEPRDHRVIAVDGQGQILRVICGYCGSQHNYRGLKSSTKPPPASNATVIKRGATNASAIATSPEPSQPIVSERERLFEPVSLDEGQYEGDIMDLEMLLRKVIREEAGITAAPIAKKWRGGTIAIRSSDSSLQEKTIPIETLFNKIVMVRNRLRVLEQQVNSSDLPDDQKLKLQGYITGCYGSLTTFNVLFAEEDDKFKGTGGEPLCSHCFLIGQ